MNYFVIVDVTLRKGIAIRRLHDRARASGLGFTGVTTCTPESPSIRRRGGE